MVGLLVALIALISYDDAHYVKLNKKSPLFLIRFLKDREKDVFKISGLTHQNIVLISWQHHFGFSNLQFKKRKKMVNLILKK